MTSTTQRLDGLLAELRRAPDGPVPTRRVAIISTPRSGSKYFCESLASSGRFGRPLEWMNGLYLSAYQRVVGVQDIQLNPYFQFILAKTTSPNGVFAINFHVDTYAYWREQNIDLLQFGFDRIYYVFRNDKLAQALSLAKAVRSGQWRAGDAATGDLSAGIANSEILNALYNLSLHEEYYKANLARHVRRAFCYEEYAASDRYFREVLADNGIPHDDIKSFSSTLRVQRTGDDAQRLQEFMSYMGRA